MKQQSGFTLIELIIVIVILGILAATALPKFADLRVDANSAALKGLQGSMSSAATIAHAAQLARGLASGVSVTLDGAIVSMVNGYPTADALGIATAVTSSDYTWQGTVGMGKNATTCFVGYVAAPVTGSFPSIGATSGVSGC